MVHDPQLDVRDDAWFEALFTGHATAVTRFLHRRMQDHSAVQDLTADVFVTAWRKRSDIPDMMELAWLYRTAGYVLANYRRKMRPVPLAELPEIPDGFDTEEMVFGEDRARRAWAALSPRDQRIVALHAWECLDGDELAATLGISRGGADAALSRARARLRDAWQEVDRAQDDDGSEHRESEPHDRSRRTR